MCAGRGTARSPRRRRDGFGPRIGDRSAAQGASRSAASVKRAPAVHKAANGVQKGRNTCSDSGGIRAKASHSAGADDHACSQSSANPNSAPNAVYNQTAPSKSSANPNSGIGRRPIPLLGFKKADILTRDQIYPWKGFLHTAFSTQLTIVVKSYTGRLTAFWMSAA